MHYALQNSKVKFYIGDVRDKKSVDGAMKGVENVFHAAALKQVPSCDLKSMMEENVVVFDAMGIVDRGIVDCRL